MTQPIFDQVRKTIEDLLNLGKVKKALEIMKKEISPISDDLRNTITLLNSRYNRLANQQTGGTIDPGSYNIQLNQIIMSLLNVMQKVPDEIRIQGMLRDLNSIYTITDADTLEKIQDGENNMVPMSWIYKCIEVSKSVCQVVRKRDRKGIGTGWMLEGGWLMTNHHVIPGVDWIEKYEIVFNYEDDLRGTSRKTSSYELETAGALFSSLFKLDYAFIKVKENGDVPLSEWGYLEVDGSNNFGTGAPVNIIQHPNGEKKQIALTKNQIINIDGKKIFYKTDTERGSSGSPVLNNDWKVIALHHAGKNEEDGGLVVDSTTGEKQGANEGILIRDIMEDIKSQRES